MSAPHPQHGFRRSASRPKASARPNIAFLEASRHVLATLSGFLRSLLLGRAIKSRVNAFEHGTNTRVQSTRRLEATNRSGR